MSVQTVIVAAGGEQTRWDKPEAKHLLRIGGQPLLLRTLAQVKRYAPEFTAVLAWHPDIKEEYPAAFMPIERDFLSASLASVHHLWENRRAVFLLGDVAFTDAALDALCGYAGPLRVIGNQEEIFGMAFDATAPPIAQRVTNALKIIIDAARRGFGRGQMWELYRVLCGFHLYQHSFESAIFYRIEDETTDFDYYAEYVDYCRKHEGACE